MTVTGARLPGLFVPVPEAWPGARIGVMGGSFNPPHEGHVIVARTALRRLRLDRLWWLVTPGNPLKANDGLPPVEDRMAAARRLASDPRMVVTSFEAELGTPFTAATIGFLVRRNPHAHFVWVMGADNLAGFHRWQQWRRIAETVPMAIVDRPGWRFAALASPAARALADFRIRERHAARLAELPPPAWAFLTNRLSNQSSTSLRAQAAADRNESRG